MKCDFEKCRVLLCGLTIALVVSGCLGKETRKRSVSSKVVSSSFEVSGSNSSSSGGDYTVTGDPVDDGNTSSSTNTSSNTSSTNNSSTGQTVTVSRPPAITLVEGAHSDEVCETDSGARDYLDGWLASARGDCTTLKVCKNCCGEEGRFDRFQAKCSVVLNLDPSTIGTRSLTVCEDEGWNYLSSYRRTAESLGRRCTTEKACANCCGVEGGGDAWFVSCGS